MKKIFGIIGALSLFVVTSAQAAIDLTAVTASITTAIADCTAGALVLMGFGASLFGVMWLVRRFGGKA